MSQSRRKSTRDSEINPYLSHSEAFVVVHRPTTEQDRGGLFDVEKEEKEIVRLTKLIEPDYLGQSADGQLTEAHLKSAISESQQELRNLKRPLEHLETVAADLVEVTRFNPQSQDGDNAILADIDHQVRDLIEEIRLIEFRKEVLEELRESVHLSSNANNRHRNRAENNFIDVHRQLCKKLSTRLSEWDSKSLRQKFSQDQSYKAFRQRIWEASGVDAIMPPLKTFLPAEAGEGEESEESSGEELEIAGGAQNYKCPLCLGYLTQPMRSTVCNHTFCKKCFAGYLEQNRSNDAPCPTSGCSYRLDRSLVALDESMANRIRQLRTRQQLRQDTQELFDDEQPSQSQRQHNLNCDDDEPKPSTQSRRKTTSTQRRRRVIVDDD